MSVETVRIARLGAQGHGVVEGDQGGIKGPIYVPHTLPGETVAIARNGTHGALISISEPSPDRIAPLCRHFDPDRDACGGCSLQHLADMPYHAFKRQLVVDALASKGMTPEVHDLVTCHPGERQRLVFSARQTEKEFLLGFNRAETNHIISIEECPIASPGIVARLEAIRAVGKSLAAGSETFRVAVLETLSGLDLAAEGLKPLSDKQRRAVTETVLTLRGIARVSVNGEIVIEPQKPLIDFGGVKVSPPPGSFTQATKRAEEAMSELVLSHVAKAKRVLDLFAGSGTFSLRLARGAKVHAVEGEEKPLKALDLAARSTQGLKPVTVEKRDLFRRPMMVSEFKNYDAVVFDPPRAGAEAQMKELARSTIKTVAAVSCNPVTLARDLRILIDGGYRIKSVTPIDQFLWSAHVEAVALLEK
ncbi:class I SAM-dependent RNA methyltransferase [Rhizobium terrae]|uniref:class I SAM-dependent RNA methyltransferase n=1 Tax=Rhizobium terrae TaxID=2171756 RepID=UPI000E3D3FFC|nr:class I SAM-dependent RNA methyltransferase [Rhizobium terrae]